MKLLQLNLWGGRLEPQILKLIGSEKPDILCLQEAIDIKGGKGLMFASTEEIQKVMNADFLFMSPVFTINYMNRTADFGNCIISKLPVVNKETIFVGKEHVINFDFLEHDTNSRNLQIADIRLSDNTVVHIMNHHGHHIDQHKDGDEETMRQCRIITDQVKKLDGKIILTGDFNLAPHSKSLEQINDLLQNLSITNKLKTTRTPLTHKTEVCDYIFVSDSVNVASFEASDEIVSDHKALLVEFS